VSTVPSRRRPVKRAPFAVRLQTLATDPRVQVLTAILGGAILLMILTVAVILMLAAGGVRINNLWILVLSSH
jgi:hypothetical protein